MTVISHPDNDNINQGSYTGTTPEKGDPNNPNKDMTRSGDRKNDRSEQDSTSGSPSEREKQAKPQQ
jgi:hypothetical protein